MCDCYWQKCEICKKKILPVHIADFCMPRDDIRVYCDKHLPKKDVVIYKLIEDESYYAEEFPLRKKRRMKYTNRRAGWRMGVRYLEMPPKEYGYAAVTPNVGCEHIAKIVTKRRKSYWTTDWLNKRHKTEVKAIRETIKRKMPLSCAQQVWRRYLLKFQEQGSLRKLNHAINVLKDIRIISQRLKRKYTDLVGIILIGSFAEGTYQRDSDIDIVFIKEKRRVKFRNLDKLTEGIKRKMQLIPLTKADANQHFKDSTTMAYAIQRGKIIYEKKGVLKKYYEWSLKWPSKDWMERWFKYWLKIYDFGVEDVKRNREAGFDNVSNSLPRAVVNFGILFLEIEGYVPTTKKDLGNYFDKEVQDNEIKEGFKIALKAHHADKDISLAEAEKVYLWENSGDRLLN